MEKGSVIKICGSIYIALGVFGCILLTLSIVFRSISGIDDETNLFFIIAFAVSVFSSFTFFIIGHYLIRKHPFSRHCAVILAALYSLVAEFIAIIVLLNLKNLILFVVFIIAFLLFTLIYITLSNHSFGKLFIESSPDEKNTFLKWIAYSGTAIQVLAMSTMIILFTFVLTPYYFKMFF